MAPNRGTTMWTKANRNRVILICDLPHIAEKLARATSKRWRDLSQVADTSLMVELLRAFTAAEVGQRDLCVGLRSAQLATMRVGHRRMLERLMLGYSGVTVHTGGLAVGLAGLGRLAVGLARESAGAGPGLAGWAGLAGAGRDHIGAITTPQPAQSSLLRVREAHRTVQRLPQPTPITSTDSLGVRKNGLSALLLGLAPARRGSGLGPISAPILLLGDRPSAGWGHETLDWPFVSAQLDGSSVWLAEQLEGRGVPEDKLHWLNAYTTSGKALPLDMLKAVSPGLVVAMGKHAMTWCHDSGATNWCSQRGVTIRQIYHPSYWRRFHSGHTYLLPKLLDNWLKSSA